MTATLLFCTSPNVTPELVRELQRAESEEAIPSRFAPARYDASAQERPGRTKVEDYVEVFENADDTELRRLLKDRLTFENGEPRNWLYDGQLVVLDERSAADKTAVVHVWCTRMPEQDEDDLIDRSDEMPTNYDWETWRVPILECLQFVDIISETAEIEQLLFLKEKDRFTNADGVFEVKHALAWYSSPTRRRADGPGLA